MSFIITGEHKGVWSSRCLEAPQLVDKPFWANSSIWGSNARSSYSADECKCRKTEQCRRALQTQLSRIWGHPILRYTRIPLTICIMFMNVYWYLCVPDPGGIVASTSSSATWMTSSATCPQRPRMIRGSSWQSQLDPLALAHWRQDLPEPCRKYTRGIETKLCTGIVSMMRIVICWTLQLASVWRHYANVLP